MKLYYEIRSPFCHKALLALYEKEIEFTPVHVNLMNENERAEYKKLYPLGKIPLLIHQEEYIPESTIIVEYLDDTFEHGPQLIPSDKTQARQVRLQDRLYDCYLTGPIVEIYHDMMKLEALKRPDAILSAHQTLDTMYRSLDERLKNNQYVASNDFSMADCAVFAPLFYAQRMYPFNDYKNLVVYFEQMMQRSSIQKLLAELLPVLQKHQNNK